MKNIGRIERHSTTDEWDIVLDARSYQVKRVTGDRAGSYDKATKTWVPGENWYVYGGGYNRSHLCDDEKPTHKRVVAWLKAQLEREGQVGALIKAWGEPPVEIAEGD